MRYSAFPILTVCVLSVNSVASAATPPDTPAIDYVVPLTTQPFSSDPAVIWYDNFDTPGAVYAYTDYDDGEGRLTSSAEAALGGTGMALRGQFVNGSSSISYIWAYFGRNPQGPSMARPHEDFNDVYWRFYVKHPKGWVGNPYKLTRAGNYAGTNGAQAFLAHIWGGSGNFLTLDPASGVSGNTVVTQGWNDTAHMTWMGQEPQGGYPMYAAQETGKWVCVEAAVKLNTPGLADGTFSHWIDGRLDNYRDKLNWRGSWTAYGINAIELENYWNGGAAADQARYFDDFVISTRRIGLARAGVNPVIVKTPFSSADATDTMDKWQVQVAQSTDGEIVWGSNTLWSGDSVAVNATNGNFRGPLARKTALAAGTLYAARVRVYGAKGGWSAWSSWRVVIQTQDKSYHVWQ